MSDKEHQQDKRVENNVSSTGNSSKMSGIASLLGHVASRFRVAATKRQHTTEGVSILDPNSKMSNYTSDEIFELNQLQRDEWVADRIKTHFIAGSRVLDVGSGTCPYKNLLSHCHYIAHDFTEYKGVKLGGGVDYGEIDIVSDITSIPIADNTIDNILCTEVLEHVPEPIEAIREFSRLLCVDGKAIITAPLMSGVHQEPFHFYGGFSPYFYEYSANKFGFEVIEMRPHGGFPRLMAQEVLRMLSYYNQENLRKVGIDSTPTIRPEEFLTLSNQLLRLDELDESRNLSIGYHVVLRKI